MSAAGRPGFRFPKTRRLTCSTEFQSVFASGYKSKDALFVIYAYKNGQQLSRLGVTVSKRVATRAVERNRIKRLIRESFRHQKKTLVGLDIVTIARGATQGSKTNQLFVSLEGHWRRVDQQCRSASL